MRKWQDLEKIQKRAGKIWKIQELAGNIWRIQNPSCETRKIQDFAGKIWNFQYLVTHHSLTRPSNSRRMTHQLAGPNLFWLLCFVV